MRKNSFIPRLLAPAVVFGAMILAAGCGGQEDETMVVAPEEDPTVKAEDSMNFMKEQLKKQR